MLPFKPADRNACGKVENGGLEANPVDPPLEHLRGEAFAVSGRDGLFLVPEDRSAHLLRAPGGPEVVFRPVTATSG
jgi:hypothetical protein